MCLASSSKYGMSLTEITVYVLLIEEVHQVCEDDEHYMNASAMSDQWYL